MTFTRAMVVTEVGVFGGTHSPNPAFTASIDYFMNLAAPIVDADSSNQSTSPSIATQPANRTVTEGQTATFSVVASGSAPLAYQWQRDGVDITGATGASYTTPATTLADTGAVFGCGVSNEAGSVTSDAATLTVTAGTISSLLSDDFNPATTEANPAWRFYDPYQGVSGASALTLDGSNALIEIPAGLSHDLWAGNSNLAPRLLQPAADEDFAIEAKFESTPVARYQLQGIVVQQDDDTFLRFSTYHDGSSLRIFAAYIDGGANTIYLTAALPGNPLYQQVIRAGNQWTYRYSDDGTTWTDAVTFTRAMVVTEVGVFGGTHSPNPAFTASIDYFMNLAAPIVDADSPNQATPPSIATQPANQTVTEGQTATFSVVASGSAPLAYQWQRDGVDIAGATGASYTTPATTLADTGAVFGCGVSNEAGSVTSDAATLTVTAGTISSLLSDDFNPATTEANPAWRFYDPYQGVSGASVLTLDGSNALIEIPAGLSHDLWAGNSNLAPRLLQPAADEDFAIEAKFESTPVAQYQIQGIVVQQDDDTFLRFSTYHDGSSLRVFVAYIDGGASTIYLTAALPGNPLYQRVIRAGNQWTYRYSDDGTTWTDAVTFTRAMVVTEVGVFGGTHRPEPRLYCQYRLLHEPGGTD